MKRFLQICSIAPVMLLMMTMASLAETTLAGIDPLVEPYIDSDTPGLAVLVMKNGKVLHMKGYGVRDIESGDPVDENTIFDLASVSKEMTAMAAMMLISEGSLSEDIEVGDILPQFKNSPKQFRPITVGDLIHHVSGLADYLNDDDADFDDSSTNEEIVSWLATRPLKWAPGTRFDYSNSGYITLGSVVKSTDDAAKLRDVLKARIWEPLGMTSTGLVDLASGVDPDRKAKGYKGTKGQFQPSEEPSVVEGDGNVLTCITDLARYEEALSHNTLLSEDSTDALFQNGEYDNGAPVKDENGAGYGFGWSLETDGAKHYASHSGSWMGTSTYYQRNLDNGVTVILLANGEDMSNVDLATAIDEAVSGDD